MDGASVSLRRVSAEDQARWRDKRRTRMMGYGALGDEGDARQRSYVHLPIPEWVLDCCMTCVEVSRSAGMPADVLDDDLFAAGFAATDAAQLDTAATAAADLLRLVVPSSVQVPVTEFLLVAQRGNYSQNHQASSTPGFLWKHARDRWDLPASQTATIRDWWTSLATGPNSATIRWPLRRFGVAMQRAFMEDRLVDFFIALEALFSRETDPQRNTSALIAERTNRLLGGDRPTRKLRTSQILSAYGMRNALVHGRLPSEGDIALSASNIERVLRDALAELLSASDQVDPTAGAAAPSATSPAARASFNTT
ncbi:MAG: hypothetical protein JF888_15645 [Candidatus Dormibacteraeota bacterium]|uniref:Apea-like HEPN domain-containing protein n=2 Tax=Candidatus Dormiibacter inghamiae TaxID=3127013 RepID=A0A934KFG4_9BACT|nr:hypothetical protein [Candidatus Dormibacteraeota bacterium]